MEKIYTDYLDSDYDLKEQVMRYVSFWPYLLISTIFFLSIAFFYLRYTTYSYESNAVIEILDEAQDSEMALPTELTVFNRSMINLENEINILKSYNLHSKVVSELNSNVSFYNVGTIKKSRSTSEEWYDNYKLDFNIDTDEVKSTMTYSMVVNENKLTVYTLSSSGSIIKSDSFESLKTSTKAHDLPFNLEIENDQNLDLPRELKITPVAETTNFIKNQITIEKLGFESDQLSVKITYDNPKLAAAYLNGLLIAFDNDGINDRQLEYQRTIEFVNEREVILKNELGLVEERKQNFKQSNNLSDLTLDAGNNITLKYNYDSELFDSESQKSIANYLLESISENKYDFLPINIGFDDFNINSIISEYNKIVSERNRYLAEAGPNNILVKSLQSQLDSMIQNISISIDNYLNTLNLKIDALKSKELEYDNIYNMVPENEKSLRSIERELTIKEALYLLLLQKREEASINLAVVRPTIKIIDYPITSPFPVFPKPSLIYLLSLVTSIIVYLLSLFIWFIFDNKIHHKEQLSKKLNSNIPIICEIPFIKDKDSLLAESNSTSRSTLSESIRMLISNLKFTNPDFIKDVSCKSILFTSSIKGEGKTLASVNTALNLSNDLDKQKKVILLGSDLRNPQVHKIFGVDKNMDGISDILYHNDIANYEKYIFKFNNLDVLFSGTIPPNPTAMLGGDSYKNLLLSLKKKYDYIIIDSAPCLLVSDTFQIVRHVDSIVYLFRSNFTDQKIVDYINEIYNLDRIKNLNVVLNAVGNSSSYGYKYGYQYGYKYGYKYGYNYGYGYGYGHPSGKNSK